jgi:Type I phosphodiesterase / nucleotide pyrophosphatase
MLLHRKSSFMTKRVKRSTLIVLLLLFAFATGSPAQQKPQQPPKKPKLILAVVVDQFRYDYLLRFRADYHGGIARLLAGGAVFADARYIHYPTVTAVGHSTFLSGATPSVSGIIGNEWFDRDAFDTEVEAAKKAGKAFDKEALKKKARVTSVSDAAEFLLGKRECTMNPKPMPECQGSSPRRLLVSTVGDELKMATKGRSRVIGISMKDRSAILPAGHMADAAYWFDLDSFVSSTYYMKEKKLPEWVVEVNKNGPARDYIGAKWISLDDQKGEKPFCSMANGGPLDFCGGIESTPFGNEMVEAFAEKVIEREFVREKPGPDDSPDILTLSFSSNDYVGHKLGPDAPEIRDMCRRTDQLLGKLLDFIDARLGQGNTLVVFTADHGVSPTPAANAARKMPGGYLNSGKYAGLISSALSAKFGKANWFLFGDTDQDYGYLYLDHETLAQQADPAAVRRYAAEVARGLPNIARVFTRDDLLRGSAAADWPGRAVELGFYGPRSCPNPITCSGLHRAPRTRRLTAMTITSRSSSTDRESALVSTTSR